MQRQPAWRNKVIYPPRSPQGMKRPPWKKIEEDRAKSCTGFFRSLSSYVSPSSSLSLPFFLADWDVNPHPSTSRHVTFLPTASTHLPNYRSSRKKREGNLSVRTMRILRSASVYGLRNVLSSFILIRLFSRTVNENNRASRRLTSIAEEPREPAPSEVLESVLSPYGVLMSIRLRRSNEIRA